MASSNYVHLEDCSVLRTTDNAILVEYDGEEIWIPRSQMPIDDDRDFGKGDYITISITEWFANKKGIET